MDNIIKFLRKLSPKERDIVKDIITSILLSKTVHLDIKKLRGYVDIFRVRKGKLRIIYRQNASGVRLLSIDNRDDNTYRGL